MMVSRLPESHASSSSRPTRRSARQTSTRDSTPENAHQGESDGEYLPDEEHEDQEPFLPMVVDQPPPTRPSPSHTGLMDLFIDNHRQGSDRARSTTSEVETEGGWSGILDQHSAQPLFNQPKQLGSYSRSHSQQTPSRQNAAYFPSASPSPRLKAETSGPSNAYYKASPQATPQWNGINPMVALPPKPWSPPSQDPSAVFQTPSNASLGRVLLPASSRGMVPLQNGYQPSSSPAESLSATSASMSSGGSSFQLSGGFGRRQRQRYSMPVEDEDDDAVDDSSPTKSFHGQGEWRRAPNPPPSASFGASYKGKAPTFANSTPMAQSSSQGAERPPEGLPSGPRSSDKPSFSYAAIIGQAILASSKGRLSLAEIYAWISAAFPYYKKGDAGWMNSIRHNLSLNKCFVKVERQKGDPNGKGMLWMIKEGTEHQFDGGGFRKRPLAGGKADGGDKQRKRDKMEAVDEQLTPVQSSAKRKMDEEPVFGDSGIKTGGLFKRPALEKSMTWTQASQKPLAPPPVPIRRTSLPPARPQRACTANVSFVDLASDDAGAMQDDDDFVTPRKAPETCIPSSALASGHLPHLTPSVSSPVSSPGPQTISRHLGRSHLNQVEAVVRQAPSSDADAEGEADEDAVVLQLKDDNHTISPAAVFAKVNALKPGFEFIPPPSRPLSPPRTKTDHAHILSPIARVRPSENRPNLPGPNSLLASSPIVSRHRRKLSSTGDLASHALNLMRPPQSPVSRSSAAASVSTPYNSSSRLSSLAAAFQSSPIRTPAGTYGSFVSQSPFGAALLQHRAEQGRGTNDALFGSDSDLLDPFCSALAVQDELQHMSSIFQSPSRPSAKWGFEGSPMATPRHRHRGAIGQSP